MRVCHHLVFEKHQAHQSTEVKTVRMKLKQHFFLYMLLVSLPAISQTNFNKFSPKISFTPPDISAWTCIRDDIAPDKSKGVLVYKHTAIIDSKGRSIVPGLIVNYEIVRNKLDAKQYSVKALYDKKYKPNRKYIGGFPVFSSDKHSAVYMGDYTMDKIKHTVVLGYFCYESIGLEVVGDATEEVFHKVQTDMMEFIKSVRINE
jgi:hypothetical protein